MGGRLNRHCTPQGEFGDDADQSEEEEEIWGGGEMGRHFYGMEIR